MYLFCPLPKWLNIYNDEVFWWWFTSELFRLVKTTHSSWLCNQSVTLQTHTYYCKRGLSKTRSHVLWVNMRKCEWIWHCTAACRERGIKCSLVLKMGIDPFWSPFFLPICVYENDIARGKSHCEKKFSKTKAGQEIFTLSQVSGRGGGAVFIGGWEIVLESTT